MPQYCGIKLYKMAEKRGFEPLRQSPDLQAFQACPFSLLGIFPFFYLFIISYYLSFDSINDLLFFLLFNKYTLLFLISLFFQNSRLICIFIF